MNKKLFTRFALIFLSIFILYKIADFYATNKVEKLITSQNIKYDAISVNLLFGDVTLKNVATVKDRLQIKATSVAIEGFSYLQYFNDQAFHFSDLKITDAIVSGILPKNNSDKENDNKDVRKEVPKIKVDVIQFDNAKIDVTNAANYPLTVESLHLAIDDFELQSDKDKTIPFLYSKIESSVQNFETQISEIQKVRFGNLSFKENSIILDSLEIIPLKSKREYIYHVEEKKELLDLFAKKIEINEIAIQEDEKVAVSIDNMLLEESNFSIYLDATVLEHPKRKKDLYSKSLRELPFLLDVKKMDITNAVLVYEELQIQENKAGVLYFDALNAQIKNINNDALKTDKLTVVAIQTKFMKESPLEVKWTFDINNKNDEFRIRGSLFDVTSKNMSAFLLPTTNVKMEGFIDEMYFDFEGNDFSSRGKLNLDFRDFDIKILDKEKNKKKVLSWLVNLFIKDSSKNGMVKTTVKDVERDETRSFWNYFWVTIESGLKKSLL